MTNKMVYIILSIVLTFTIGEVIYLNYINRDVPSNTNINPNLITPITVVNMDSLRKAKGNPPSYCDPLQYHIELRDSIYVAILPHGTVMGSFKTAEDAQNSINRSAKYSLEQWNKIGDF